MPADADLREQLASWKPDRTALRALFSERERRRLEEARGAVGGPDRTLAYCVYENPFARAGGIFAVAESLPPSLGQGSGEVVLLSPFHRRLETAPRESSLGRLGEIRVPFGGEILRARLLEHRDGKKNRWVLIKARGFFDARGGPSRRDPYDHGDSGLLLRDALFLCAALPHALAKLGFREKLIVHLQDWQLAAAALSVKEALLDGVLDSAAVVLTSHNSYDHPLPAEQLGWITRRTAPRRWPLGADTAYQRMIPLTDAPLSTVSRRFARELKDDPLQSECFARHLQRAYRAQGLVGINNAVFGELKPAYSRRARQEALAGNVRRILAEKARRRRRMLRALAEHDDGRILGRLDGGDGAPLLKLPPEIPVFMMFGRLDPGQKGFDLLARAIETLPAGAARFVLTPIVTASAGAFSDDLAALAEARPGDVVVYPFRMENGYRETMAGASFVVMPSLFEPFGAATEAYLAGTPVLARASGGLVEQVTGLDRPRKATGLLWRERAPRALDLGGQWRAVAAASTPAERMDVPLYSLLVMGLADALEEAVKVWRGRPALYGRMLGNLFAKAEEFSPERTAAAYTALYDVAASPAPRAA